MPPVGFERTISLGERPQIYALDREAAGISKNSINNIIIVKVNIVKIDQLFLNTLTVGYISIQFNLQTPTLSSAGRIAKSAPHCNNAQVQRYCTIT